MKTIRIENLEGLAQHINNNREPLKIISESGEAVLINVQTWNYLERLLEDVENIRLLQLAQNRNINQTISFEDLIAEEGFDFDEVRKLAETLEIE